MLLANASRSGDQVSCGIAHWRAHVQSLDSHTHGRGFRLNVVYSIPPPIRRQSLGQNENLNPRWHANLAAPAELAGAVRMNGTASMAPGTKSGNTTVLLPSRQC